MTPHRAREAEIGELLARVGVAVRPLEWVTDHIGGGLMAGEYRVRAGLWTRGYFWVRGEDDPHTGYVELDDAKAAAQADYEARIISSLRVMA